jgi:hypothetical protein
VTDNPGEGNSYGCKSQSITEANGIVDKKVEKAGCQDNPGPMNTIVFFHEVTLLIIRKKYFPDFPDH